MAHPSTGGSHTFIWWSSVDEVHGEQRRGKRTVPGGTLGVKAEWGIERLSQVGSTPALFRHLSETMMRKGPSPALRLAPKSRWLRKVPGRLLTPDVAATPTSSLSMPEQLKTSSWPKASD